MTRLTFRRRHAMIGRLDWYGYRDELVHARGARRIYGPAFTVLYGMQLRERLCPR